MPLVLTEEQRRLLLGAPGGPIEVIDPSSDASYVLLRTDAFARLAAQADPYPPRDGMDEPYLLETR